ncbi:MAG TPA: hypothetical protein VF884_15885 [Nitrososphaeraceae archaeon]
MPTEDIEKSRKVVLVSVSGSRGIVLRKGLCEILQKIGKIEEIQVAGGKYAYRCP